ncbi:hypothetical protein H6F89_33600 [Cyanobacteria bacterium FACHB-63]|nr:hypothetical protein [Cyanobacteria bacterium FACHB-63]
MPRRPAQSGDKSPNTKDRVRFIFEPDRNSPNGITYSWLIHNAYDGKEKAAAATRSFWMPFAARDSGKISETELRELAQQCLWRLEEQMNYIRENFDLELPNRVIASTSTLNPPPVESSAVDSPGSQSSEDPFFGDLDLSIEDNMLGDIGDALG